MWVAVAPASLSVHQNSPSTPAQFSTGHPAHGGAVLYTHGGMGVWSDWRHRPFLVGQQWDTFSSTFLHFFNWQGALMYGAVFCAVKVVHELGMRIRRPGSGCRVPTIGVLMVMMPVLYSDISDAYRLNSRRKRLWIAAAGVVAELGLSLRLRRCCGVPAGRTAPECRVRRGDDKLAMSLAINLNPLMRFDGYYLLTRLAWDS